MHCVLVSIGIFKTGGEIRTSPDVRLRTDERRGRVSDLTVQRLAAHLRSQREHAREELPRHERRRAAPVVQQEQQQRQHAGRARPAQVPRVPQHGLRRERRQSGQGQFRGERR